MIIAKIEPVNHARCFTLLENELKTCHAFIPEFMIKNMTDPEDYCGAFGEFIPDGFRCKKCLESEFTTA